MTHHPECEDATGEYPGSCTCAIIKRREEAMTEIEKKANALMNEVSKEHGFGRLFDTHTREHGGLVYEGLCQAIEQNEALQADNVKLREALVGLTTDEDDDPCWFDHNGNCLAHFITNPCEMAFARKALQETGQ